METERSISNAWCIGRYERVISSFETDKISAFSGELCSGLEIHQKFEHSSATVQISLERNVDALTVTLDVDWNEASAHDGAVPVLTYFLPLKQGESLLNPRGSATRAEVAAIITCFIRASLA